MRMDGNDATGGHTPEQWSRVTPQLGVSQVGAEALIGVL